MTVFHTQTLPLDRREGRREIFKKEVKQELRIKDTYREGQHEEVRERDKEKGEKEGGRIKYGKTGEVGPR